MMVTLNLYIHIYISSGNQKFKHSNGISSVIAPCSIFLGVPGLVMSGIAIFYLQDVMYILLCFFGWHIIMYLYIIISIYIYLYHIFIPYIYIIIYQESYISLYIYISIYVLYHYISNISYIYISLYIYTYSLYIIPTEPPHAVVPRVLGELLGEEWRVRRQHGFVCWNLSSLGLCSIKGG